MRIACVGVIVFALIAVIPANSAHGQSSAVPETVVVKSGNLRLTALVWRPTGPGPFPAVLFSHGSGRRVDTTVAQRRANLIGPLFAKHGYLVMYLFRRGYGLSEAQGEPFGEILDRAEKAGGSEAVRRRQVALLTTDYLDDTNAGFSALKSLRGIDRSRIALAGHSLGGQLSLLAAARSPSIRAVVTFAAAAQSWDEVGPGLQALMLSAVRNARAPIFLCHAANDYSIAPGQMMAAELERLQKTHELKIYPALGTTAAEGHDAVHTDVAAWEGDVFRFLDRYMKR